MPEDESKELGDVELRKLEGKKLWHEIEQLKRDRKTQKRRHWISIISQIIAACAVILTVVGVHLEQKRFETSIDTGLRQIEIAHRNSLKQLEAQFDTANASRYWASHFQICLDIVTSAGRLRFAQGIVTSSNRDAQLLQYGNEPSVTLTRRTLPDARRDFQLLTYGTSAMIEDLKLGELRKAMADYDRESAKCHSSLTCWDKIENCVERIACVCRALICTSIDGESSKSKLPGCKNLDCKDLVNACKSTPNETMR